MQGIARNFFTLAILYALAGMALGIYMGLSQDQYGKDELFWGVRVTLEELARRTPLVVVFDDIHWAEASFLNLIEDVRRVWQFYRDRRPETYRPMAELQP